MNNDDVENIMNTLSEMLKKSDNSSNDSPNNSSNSNNIDFDSLKSIINNLNNNQKNTTDDFQNIDIDTFMKIKNIMSQVNITKNSSSANLLRALKPYLNDSRKSKLDKYIQFLSIGNILKSMDLNGGVIKK